MMIYFLPAYIVRDGCFQYTECPKIYRISVLHLLKHTFHVGFAVIYERLSIQAPGRIYRQRQQLGTSIAIDGLEHSRKGVEQGALIIWLNDSLCARMDEKYQTRKKFSFKRILMRTIERRSS